MRCIEMNANFESEKSDATINRNMRCIEMAIRRLYAICFSD